MMQPSGGAPSGDGAAPVVWKTIRPGGGTTATTPTPILAPNVASLSKPAPLSFLNGKLFLASVGVTQTYGLVRNGYFDIVLPGNWVLLDATGLSGGSYRNLGAGDVATVIIRSDPNATPQVAHIRIDTNATPNPMWTFYSGEWLDGPFAHTEIAFTQLNVWKINE